MSYTYDFNVIVDRSRERSKTWDPRNVKPGQLPMNGAEMHFACPIPVLEAVREVSECQVYGYPYFTDDFAQAAAGWMKRRHDWDVDYKWVEFVGGIVPGIAFAMQAMTKVGDGIIINTPAYSPFRDCIRDNDRKLVESGLLIDSEKGTVEFDWADMEAKFADPNNTCFILCDPQNPTGKSCTLEELKKIEELSKKYNVFVIVDEVHADFVFDGKRHICYPTVGDFAKGFSAVVINPSKTFNTAGFRTAAIIIPNQEIHDKTNVKIAAVKGYSRTITGVAAFEAAYGGKCDDFADQAHEYVQTMRNKMCDYFAENIPEMKIIKPEACFVCWCDCHGLGFEDQGEMMKFLAEAGVLMSNGLEYDKELGRGYVRIAYGFPEIQLMPALEKLAAAVKARRK
ncbi:MAG: aminotransferase class I/II-fold pyridoxal phosphate-dependent enzyme [Angelakisella sp.]|jgi:cystathionine beta-lyase|nr:aminotransferase class I/II-fold pyridoxal phosphate-dependent enzyme [Angelakisella sp.]